MLDTSQILLRGEALLWFRQGLAAAVRADHEDAIAHFNQVLEIHPDFYEAWYERGLVLESRGSYLDAIASFDRALSLKPPLDAICEIWHDQGNAFQYGLGNYNEAIQCYAQTLKIKPDHELAWQNRGNALLYGLNRPEQALDCYRQVLAINRDNAVAWRNRGNALLELNRNEEAIACFDRALALQPEDQIAWCARSQALDQTSVNYNEPTTNPAWTSAGYDETSVTGDDSATVQVPSVSPPETADFVAVGQPFLVVTDDWGEREISLDQEQYSIGRDPTNDICLHSRFASRHHAVLSRIQAEEDGPVTHQIMDGSTSGKPSTNGLIVNGQKVQTLILRPGDLIVFGPKVQATYRRR